jgi:hypothetical protein
VAAVVVFFFNTNLLPSPFALQAFYATMNKKEGATIVAFFSLLQKKKESKATVVTFFAMLQGKKKRRRLQRCCRRLFRCVALRYAATK